MDVQQQYTEKIDDLSALAWVQDELRRSLEAAHKALRRHLKESEAAAGSDVDAVDPGVLRQARSSLHQGVGALELVGLPAAAQLLRASETAVSKLAAKPKLFNAAAVEKIERASFALLDYLQRMLAAKPVSPLALFPQYRALRELAGGDRVHPADLWPHDWRWRSVDFEPGAQPRRPDAQTRSAVEMQVLSLMRQPEGPAAQQMSDLFAGLAAGAGEGTLATLWQLASAFFEAQAQGLLKADVYSKRMASRLLAQLRISERGEAEVSDRLAQDLLFFCAQAAVPGDGRRAPRLAAVRRAFALADAAPIDYEAPRLGRFDPAWIAQARKRVAAAREGWSAIAGGELLRLSSLVEQFTLVGDSLVRLYPGGELLAHALKHAAAQTAASDAAPSAELAMEVATAILWLDASLEDGELDHPEQAERVRRLAGRIDRAREGQPAETLEPWMEELYRHVSDRQTMGSVVQELRASLLEVEKTVDQYFRDTAQRDLLIPVPAQLQAMRGVLSVLGLEQASHAVVRMRDDVERLLQVGAPLRAEDGVFDRLAANLGTLGFLVDMLAVQPQMAKTLFVYDASTGHLHSVVGGGASRVHTGFGTLDAAARPVEPSLMEQAQSLALAAAHPEVPLDEVSRSLEKLAQEALAADQRALAGRIDSARRALRDADGEVQQQSAREEIAHAMADFVSSLSDAGTLEPPPAPAPAPGKAAISSAADDPEMREVFLEEAREVLQAAEQALAGLAGTPDDVAELTAVRRAFHTLKGSSRMVGLADFGEAAWACEQLYNARLAEAPRADEALLHFSAEALSYLGDWVDHIADGRRGGHAPRPVQEAAEALRLEGRLAALPLPGLAEAPAAAEPALPVGEAGALDFDLDFGAVEAMAPGGPPTPPAAPAEPTEISLEIEAVHTGFGAEQLDPASLFERVAGLPSSQDLDLNSRPLAFDELPPTSPLDMLDAMRNVAPIELPSAPGKATEAQPPAQPAPAPAPAALPAGAETAAPSEQLPPVPVSVAEAPAPAPAPVAEAPAPAPAPVAEAPSPAPLPEVEPPEAVVEPAAAVPMTVAEDLPVSDAELLPAEPALPHPVVSEVDFALDLAVEEPSATVPMALAPSRQTPPVDEAAPVAAAPAEAEASIPSAAAAPALDAGGPGSEPEPEPEPVKQVGPLQVPIPLFNIYLNEADEQSRRLATELAEWSLELHLPLPDSTVALAHSLAGNSATVGYAELSLLARALEHGLMRSQQAGGGTAEEAGLFVDTADEIRRLLHQFAAGFLRPVPPELLARLEAHERAARPAFRQTRRGDEDEDLASAFGELGRAELKPLAPMAPVPGRAVVASEAQDDDEDIDAVDAVDAELFPIFEEEGQELLPQLSSRLREWARHPADPSAAAACMRTLHTLKGGARLAGAMRLGERAHRLETAIEHLLARGDVSAADVEALLQRGDGLSATFDALRAGGLDTVQELPLAAPAPQPVAPAVPLAVPPPEPVATVQEPVPPAAAAPEAAPVPAIDWSRFGAPLPASAPAERPSAGVAAQGAVRVRTPLLDRLVNHAGEVSITRARLETDVGQLKGSLGDLGENLERLRRQLRDLELQAESQIASRIEQAKAASQDFDPLEMDRFTRFQELTRMMAESVNDVATVQRSLQRTLQSAEDDLAAQARLTRDLQDDLLRTRMVEFEGLSERLYRVVRQAAKETGKQVRLDILGGSIEVDRGVLDRMTASFEHLLRNCVTHGIEAPQQRLAAGKEAGGRITVALTQEGNEVGIEFRDDGAGLDLARIRDKGIAQGLIAPDARPSDAELANLIFTPGFSTAETVTELAGRGVGMDVVRAEVNAMGGRIETATAAGQGTSFRLVLPLTTAVTQVVMLRCGSTQVAVPSTLVELVRRATAAEIDAAHALGSFEVDGKPLPFFWLGALLQSGARSEETTRSAPVVIIRSAQQRVALHVDEVLGNQEVVVKNLGAQLSRLPGLAGLTLLASGSPALIYNPVALATLFGESARAATREALAAPVRTAQAAPVQPATPLVLVVDDSLTVRRVTQRLLVREGYRVAVAKDGLDALERLAEETPAVVLSDIEMPRMDGFDLVRNLRADARWRALPVIMITSRIAQKHRDVAAELGVNHYLGKPYSEEELLTLVARHVAQQAPLAS